jgi:hypothetical protein
VGLRVRHLDLLRGRCEVAESATEGPLREQKFVDLRHTCASLLIAQGASVNTVQAQLGLRRGRHGPTRTEGSGTILEKAEEQAADLLLVVEVGRLELRPASRKAPWWPLCWWPDLRCLGACGDRW